MVGTRRVNVFSLVERFTIRHSSTETDPPNRHLNPRDPIVGWKNACRKDERDSAVYE
jgi:hypothetical protein